MAELRKEDIIYCKMVSKWQRLLCISVTIWPLRSVISLVESLKKTSAIDLKRATDKLSDVHLFNATKNLVGPTTLNCLISFLIRFSSSTCIEKDFFHILEIKKLTSGCEKICNLCRLSGAPWAAMAPPPLRFVEEEKSLFTFLF